MKVVIIGAGEVGYHVIGALYRENMDITAIDINQSILSALREEFNIQTLLGSASDAKVLREARVQEADLFMAVTNSDDTNIISCLMAAQSGAAKRIARVKSIDLGSRPSLSGQHHLGIDLIINPYEVAADHLVNLISNPQVTDFSRFMDSKVLLVSIPIRPGSPLAEKRISHFGQNANLPQTLIALVQRKGQSTIPHGDHIIRTGDELYFFVASHRLRALYKYLELSPHPARRVFINGGGHIGFTLARHLEKLDIEVRILEISAQRCDLLSQWLDQTLVLNTDGSSSRSLAAEGIERADFFISVTNEDHVNLVACLLAKELGVDKAVALVKQPEMLPILRDSTPLDLAFSPRLLTARRILRFTRGQNTSSFFAFPGSDIEILELTIPAGMPCEKVPISSLDLPEGVLVGAVRREENIFIPRGNDHLQENDTILLIQKRRNRRITNGMFLARQGQAGFSEARKSAAGVGTG